MAVLYKIYEIIDNAKTEAMKARNYCTMQVTYAQILGNTDANANATLLKPLTAVYQYEQVIIKLCSQTWCN
jgi:hypothetical protein